jgi:hypothetical protein
MVRPQVDIHLEGERTHLGFYLFVLEECMASIFRVEKSASEEPA